VPTRFRRLFDFVVDWLGHRSLLVLAACLCVVIGTWTFIVLLDVVKAGGTQRFDEWAITQLGKYHGGNFEILDEVGRDITALGGIAVLVIFTLAVVGFLLITHKYGAMWLVIIATGGGLALSGSLKWFIDRQRPQLTQHYSGVYTSSFPSGHSMMSAVVYLTLGSLLARLVKRRRLKFYFLLVALTLTFLVGISRVYMGVHWPSDVLAGWTAGLVWAILCWLAARKLQILGAVEKDNEDEVVGVQWPVAGKEVRDTDK
jgi:undecaprenyl-diphosphatase